MAAAPTAASKAAGPTYLTVTYALKFTPESVNFIKCTESAMVLADNVFFPSCTTSPTARRIYPKDLICYGQPLLGYVREELGKGCPVAFGPRERIANLRRTLKRLLKR